MPKSKPMEVRHQELKARVARLQLSRERWAKRGRDAEAMCQRLTTRIESLANIIRCQEVELQKKQEESS